MRVLQDLQHAWRSVYKNPGLACFAIASLVLGVGVNTAIFSLVYGVLLRDLPLHDARLVVQVQGTSKLLFNYPQFREMRQQSMIFADAVGMSTAPAVVELGADSQRIDAEFVTGDYFSFFEGKAEIGRLLNEDDDRTEGAQPVCVLSDQEWRVRFEGDPRILGRFVRVNTVALQVIGVVAPNFAGASLQKKYDLWIPTAMLRQLENESRDNPFSTGLQVLAKLKTGVSMTQALGLLKAASPRIDASLPAQGVFSGETYQVIAASKGLDDWRSELGRPLCLLMATVGVVLLIACANLTNLLLARATARQREFAVKISLGIGRATTRPSAFD